MDREASNVSVGGPGPRKRSQADRRKSTAWDHFHRDTKFFDDLKEFSNDTSAHGVKFIFDSPLRIIKLLFLFISTFMLIYALYTICARVVHFKSMPSGTEYKIILTDEAKRRNHGIKFPTITVCSLNKVKKSFLYNEGYEPIKEYFEIVEKGDSEILADLVQRMNESNSELSQISNLTYESLIENGGPAKDRVLYCKQRAQYCENLPIFINEHGVNEWVSMENSMKGRCWRVNPNGQLRGKMGDYGALKLAFWADVQDYFTQEGENFGFLVSFHDNDTYGSTFMAQYHMSPGLYYKVGLKLDRISWNEQKIESCNASVGRTTYGSYNEGSCVLECKDRSLNDSCGCVNILPPENNGKYRPCTLMEWASCGLSHYEEWYKNFTDTNRENPVCECDTACEEIIYQPDISTSTISQEYADSIEQPVQGVLQYWSNEELNISYSNSEDILSNLMVMEVLFTSMQEVVVKETIVYDWNDLLSDIGGVLGLFLGASTITFIEFIIFFIVSVTKRCCKTSATRWLS